MYYNYYHLPKPQNKSWQARQMSQGRFEANMANDTNRFYLLLFIHNFLNSVYI